MRYKVYDTNSMTLPGVWQDGLLLHDPTYQALMSNTHLGSHVGNDPYILWAANGTYGDWTYNASYCADVASYVATYGVTYAASYYRTRRCNIRALGWI